MVADVQMKMILWDPIFILENVFLKLLVWKGHCIKHIVDIQINWSHTNFATSNGSKFIASACRLNYLVDLFNG